MSTTPTFLHPQLSSNVESQELPCSFSEQTQYKQLRQNCEKTMKTIIGNKVKYGMSSGKAFIFTKSNENIKVRGWQIHRHKRWFCRRWLRWLLTTTIYLQGVRRALQSFVCHQLWQILQQVEDEGYPRQTDRQCQSRTKTQKK